MSPEEYEKCKPQLYEAVLKAITKAAAEHPIGFLEWLEMDVTPETIKKVQEGFQEPIVP